MAEGDAPFHIPTTPAEPSDTLDGLMRGASAVDADAGAPGSPGSQMVHALNSLLREPSGQDDDELTLGPAGFSGPVRPGPDPFGDIQFKSVFAEEENSMAALNSQIQEVVRQDDMEVPQPQRGMNLAHMVRAPSTMSCGPLTPTPTREFCMSDDAGAIYTSKLSAFAAQPLAPESLRPGPGGAIKQEAPAGAHGGGGGRPPTLREPYQEAQAPPGAHAPAQGARGNGAMALPMGGDARPPGAGGAPPPQTHEPGGLPPPTVQPYDMPMQHGMQYPVDPARDYRQPDQQSMGQAFSHGSYQLNLRTVAKVGGCTDMRTS
ncbi:hypothetical protein T484DRAFT_1781048 [Baffinella frigidus]|nr:hypothetical protein T484DRAFT_1781048 [Cryptophyta sp. CCMP2293]